MWRALLLLTLACLSAARAAPPQATAAYERAVAHFVEGRFAEALSEFERAYSTDPAATLLYNMARCHEEMGQVAQATARFKAYLAQEPAAPDRTDIERRIRVMQAVDRQAQEAPVIIETPGPDRTVVILLGSAGVASLVGGVLLGINANELDAQYTADLRRPSQKASLADSARQSALWANVSYAVGGGLLIGGALVWWLDDGDAPLSAVMTPTGLGVRGRF